MKIAIIDLYGEDDNSGIHAIENIIYAHSPSHLVKTYQVRMEDHWPEIADWDIIISSGGPGDPAEKNLDWSEHWRQFMQVILLHNASNPNKKSVFLICFSFQLFCHHFDLAETSKRDAPSYGPYACSLTPFGKKDAIFGQLPEIFEIADFRFFQVTQPNPKKLDAMGAQILALEKERPHIKKERALMGIRFTREIWGVQFHPEADGDRVKHSFLSEKEKFIKILGQKHYDKIIRKLQDTSGLNLTHNTILPEYLDYWAKQYK